MFQPDLKVSWRGLDYQRRCEAGALHGVERDATQVIDQCQSRQTIGAHEDVRPAGVLPPEPRESCANLRCGQRFLQQHHAVSAQYSEVKPGAAHGCQLAQCGGTRASKALRTESEWLQMHICRFDSRVPGVVQARQPPAEQRASRDGPCAKLDFRQISRVWMKLDVLR